MQAGIYSIDADLQTFAARTLLAIYRPKMLPFSSATQETTAKKDLNYYSDRTNPRQTFLAMDIR